MSIIKKLPPQLADMIAAGEVVERPASVVKELFENAADAGARAITVEIENGGLTYISVSDNGSGIASDDVQNAFLRHATSKISDAQDLEAILTLGFRGEALAAISSVSRIELLTRYADEDEGTLLCLEGGEVISQSPAARAAGTTITVRDLFFNTPARQKFVKTDRAEAAAITAAVIRLALSRPDIAVRYVRDGAEELRTSGDGRTDSCIYAALGRDFSNGALEISSENEGVIAGGFISKVSALRGNRNAQYFFVNGRCVRSKTLQAALEQAYRNRMFTGRFPACVIYIETGAGRLDVNVHPAKTEVKFLFEKHVFDAVYYGAMAALDGDSQPQAVLAPQKAASEPKKTHNSSGNSGADNIALPADMFMRWDAPRVIQPKQDFLPVHSGAAASPDAVLKNQTASVYSTAVTPTPEKPVAALEAEIRDFRVIGEALCTYIIVESGDSIWLIDKHAAHERINFDKLRLGDYNPMPQLLLEPVIINPGDDGAQLLLENAELLRSLGFELEDFGGGRLAVRQIPTLLEPDDAECAVTDICTELRRGGDMTRRRDEVFASVACKAAIKAGKSSELQELELLAKRVMSGEIRHCPHGRPVAVELTKPFIDKSFKRI